MFTVLELDHEELKLNLAELAGRTGDERTILERLAAIESRHEAWIPPRPRR